MAITFNNSKVYGIATFNSFELIPIDSDETVVDVEIVANEAKDPLYILLDLSECIVPIDIELINTDGKAINTFRSSETGLVIIPVTTLNYADNDGKLKVKLDAKGNSLSKDMNVKIGSFSHIPVVNH